MSAAAFAKGLLDLEGQLTPILVCSLDLNGVSFVLCVCLYLCVNETIHSFVHFSLL